MEKPFPSVALLLAIIGGAVLSGLYFWPPSGLQQSRPKAPTTSEPRPLPTALTTPAPTVTPAIGQDSAPALPPTPLPALNNSDAQMLADIQNLADGTSLASVLVKEEVIRKLVRAVYGLSEGKVVKEYRPIDSPRGQIVATKIGQQTPQQQALFRISHDNYARYTPFISLFSLLNNSATVALYHRYSPLFEQAYHELGTGEGSFHATLLQAVDIILKAPDIDSAMLLTHPSVSYKFQDPQLENLLPVHKLMLRMGRENSEVLKLELRKFKALLTASP